MAKKWKYHKSHTYHDVQLDAKINVLTQQYAIGVYVCIYGHPKHDYIQSTTVPSGMVKAEKAIKKCQERGEIRDLEFGTEIIVTEVDGLYKQIEDE